MKTHIPNTWLHSKQVDTGFLPTLGIGRKGSRIRLRTSRSIYVVSLLAFLAGLGLLQVDAGFPIWVFAPPLIIGAVVAPFAVPMTHRFIGIGFEVDLSDRTATLLQRQHERRFVFDEIIGLQHLDAMNGRASQLNLVFSNDFGEVERTCIYCHVIGYYVRRMARRFAARVPWPVFTSDGQTIGEPTDARESAS